MEIRGRHTGVAAGDRCHAPRIQAGPRTLCRPVRALPSRAVRRDRTSDDVGGRLPLARDDHRHLPLLGDRPTHRSADPEKPSELFRLDAGKIPPVISAEFPSKAKLSIANSRVLPETVRHFDEDPSPTSRSLYRLSLI